MSNYNTKLQSNNIDLQTVIQTLQTKATPSSEDVTDETSAYTEKIEQLTTAVTALETELAGKAGGGGAVVATWNGIVYGSHALGSIGTWNVHYIDSDLKHQSFDVEPNEEYPIIILANSFIVAYPVDMPDHFAAYFPHSNGFEIQLGGN